MEGTGFINRPEQSTKTHRRFKHLCGPDTRYKSKPKNHDVNECPLPPLPNDRSINERPQGVKRKRNQDNDIIKNISNNINNKKQRIQPSPESILFLPFTPNSCLKKEVQHVEDLINGGSRVTKVRVIERNGLSLSHQLCNKTPWRKDKCQEPTCVPCGTQPGSCRKKNITYRLVCVSCAVSGVSSVYIGETEVGNI